MNAPQWHPHQIDMWWRSTPALTELSLPPTGGPNDNEGPSSMTRIAWIDTETSGLDPIYHDAWEVAAIVRDTDDPGPDAEHVWQFSIREGHADPKALEVSGFETRFLVRTGRGWGAARIGDGLVFNLSRAEAVAEIQDVLRDAWIVGANPGFDNAFLAVLFGRAEHKVTWQYRLTDIESMVMTRMGWPTPRSLRESAEALGIEVDEATRHTALGDAKLCRAIYDALIPVEEP